MNDEKTKKMINTLKIISEKAVTASEMLMPDQFVSVDYSGHVRWVSVCHYRIDENDDYTICKQYDMKFNRDESVDGVYHQCISYLDEIISAKSQEVI